MLQLSDTTQGPFGIRIEEPEKYHANGAIGSHLAQKALVAPMLVKDTMEGRLEFKASPVMELGKAIHIALLEPDEEWDARVAVKPKGMKFTTKDGKAWKAANADKIMVEHDVPEIIALIRSRAPADVLEMLHKGKHPMSHTYPGESEYTWRAVIDDLGIQARPDLYIPHINTIFDLKTTSQFASFDRQVTRYGYHFQAGWYRAVKRTLTPDEDYPAWAWIVVETVPPYRSEIVCMDQGWHELIDDMAGEAIERIYNAMESGDWSSDRPSSRVLECPEWLYGKHTELVMESDHVD